MTALFVGVASTAALLLAAILGLVYSGYSPGVWVNLLTIIIGLSSVIVGLCGIVSALGIVSRILDNIESLYTAVTEYHQPRPYRRDTT